MAITAAKDNAKIKGAVVPFQTKLAQAGQMLIDIGNHFARTVTKCPNYKIPISSRPTGERILPLYPTLAFAAVTLENIKSAACEMLKFEHTLP